MLEFRDNRLTVAPSHLRNHDNPAVTCDFPTFRSELTGDRVYRHHQVSLSHPRRARPHRCVYHQQLGRNEQQIFHKYEGAAPVFFCESQTVSPPRASASLFPRRFVGTFTMRRGTLMSAATSKYRPIMALAPSNTNPCLSRYESAGPARYEDDPKLSREFHQSQEAISSRSGRGRCKRIVSNGTTLYRAASKALLPKRSNRPGSASLRAIPRSCA